MGSVTFTVRLDSENKIQAEQVLKELGLNLTSAINIYINTIARERKIPFDLALKKEADYEQYLAFKHFDERLKKAEAEAYDANVKKYTAEEALANFDKRVAEYD